MKILVLGGTVFVGKHVVLQALTAGHDVTLFNRGKSCVNAFPDLEQIHGDRDGGLGALAGRKWDAVIDTCGYVPRIVRQSVDALKDSVDRYCFVSTISVYKIESGQETVSESDQVAILEDPNTEQITGETYGGLKVLCENEVQAGFGERALVVRPGLIVGPDDPTDRFSYWVNRFSQGGNCVVPAAENQPVQVVDVRDLARWMIHAVTIGASGTYNAAAPQTPYMLGDMLHEIASTVGAGSRLHTISADVLEANGVGPWMDLPLYLGADEEGFAMLRANIERAVALGFTYRSLQETVTDTLTWLASRPTDQAWKAGLKAEKEKELLATLGL